MEILRDVKKLCMRAKKRPEFIAKSLDKMVLFILHRFASQRFLTVQVSYVLL